MIRQVQSGSSTSLDSTIEVEVPTSDLEDSFEHQRRTYSVNSDDLNFADFDWEYDGRAKRGDSTGPRRKNSLDPHHVKRHAYNGASSGGSPPTVKHGSPGRSPLVHAHTVEDHKRMSSDDKHLHPVSSSLSRLDDKKRSSVGSDSLKVPSVVVDTRTVVMSDQSQSENGASASAKRKGLQRTHEVRTADLE